MSHPGEIFIMLGHALPEDFLLERVKDSIKKYEENKTEANKRHLSMAMNLFSVKVETSTMSVDEALKLFSEKKV